MASPLKTVCLEVLQHIAFHVATASLPRPPQYLISLLLTCSSIHEALNIHGCPQLYASIFQATFDCDIALHSQIPDSVLAAELCRRYRFMWRIRCMDLSSDLTPEEAWAAMHIVLENTEYNGRLLSSAGFSVFMMKFVLERLSRAGAANLLPLTESNTTSMAMWLLCLTLSHQDVVDTPKETQEALRELLRFTAVSTQTVDTQYMGPPDNQFVIDHQPLIRSGLDWAVMNREVLLEKATPIIILIFAFNEVVPITIPSHVPETRAIAIASQRPGPTVEDFRAISRGRTPLFAETKMAQTRIAETNPAAAMSNPTHLSLFQSRLNDYLYRSYMGPMPQPIYIYVPGFLSGLWEGSFMVSGEPIPTDPLLPPLLGKFYCLKPMQCAITEYLCFSPHLPVPITYSLDVLESAVTSGGFGYEKYSVDTDIDFTRRNPASALDVILLGETLPEHEQAWGGYKFAGRIRADGFMIMCREPKNPSDREGLGTWIFEGHLRYGVALVGQWRTSVSTATYDLRGIFSLGKICAAWQ